VAQAAGPSAVGATQQAFLQQMLAHGVPAVEFHGLAIDQELLNFDGQAADAVPVRVQALRFLTDHAQQFGYARQGNRFVRVAGPVSDHA